MDIEFQPLNPGEGNQSFRLCISVLDEETEFLVDPGFGFETERVPQRSVDGILLTHAHADHYYSIGDVAGPDTRVFTSPTTADLLPIAYDRSSHGELRSEWIVGLRDWVHFGNHVAIAPVPSGHAPGAVGFLIRVTGVQDATTILVVGDWTPTPLGGQPPLPVSELEKLEIDILFASVATGDCDIQRSAGSTVGQMLAAAADGNRVVVPVPGPLGAQVGSQIARVSEELAIDVSTTAVGRVGKLLGATERIGAGVETVPVFGDPEDVVDEGQITLAAPADGRGGSANAVLNYVDTPDRRDGSVVYQFPDYSSRVADVVGTPVTDARIATHPTTEAIGELIDTLQPVHTVGTHLRRGGSEFERFDSIFWSAHDAEVYTLVENGQWQYPRWMGKGLHSRTHDTDTTVDPTDRVAPEDWRDRDVSVWDEISERETRRVLPVGEAQRDQTHTEFATDQPMTTDEQNNRDGEQPRNVSRLDVGIQADSDDVDPYIRKLAAGTDRSIDELVDQIEAARDQLSEDDQSVSDEPSADPEAESPAASGGEAEAASDGGTAVTDDAGGDPAPEVDTPSEPAEGSSAAATDSASTVGSGEPADTDKHPNPPTHSDEGDAPPELTSQLDLVGPLFLARREPSSVADACEEALREYLGGVVRGTVDPEARETPVEVTVSPPLASALANLGGETDDIAVLAPLIRSVVDDQVIRQWTEFTDREDANVLEYPQFEPYATQVAGIVERSDETPTDAEAVLVDALLWVLTENECSL
ncbi:MBL fold metallo-hydrolase [Halobaculum sp. MBLA0147]|uniref:MBL fold metallo-hydrolase n=1 Tax=Halobaculum sp. MBLA0147 TaxID=3079934 RepID=UPI003523F0BA